MVLVSRTVANIATTNLFYSSGFQTTAENATHEFVEKAHIVSAVVKRSINAPAVTDPLVWLVNHKVKKGSRLNANMKECVIR